MDVHQAVDQRRRHGLDDGRVFGTVASAYHHRAFGQAVFAHALVQDQGVKRFLDFMGRGVEFIQEKDKGLRANNIGRRVEAGTFAIDLGNAQQIFGGQLTSQQGDALHADSVGEALRKRTFSDTWRAPHKNRAHYCDVEQKVNRLGLVEFNGGLHGFLNF